MPTLAADARSIRTLFPGYRLILSGPPSLEIPVRVFLVTGDNPATESMFSKRSGPGNICHKLTCDVTPFKLVGEVSSH